MTTAKNTYRTIVLVMLAALCATSWTIHLSRRGVRQQLFAELKPVQLTNCDMKRFGADYDGGYVLCENLASEVDVAYSYGIAGRDEWGCDVSRWYDVAVHQYDCFDLSRPMCDRGRFIFHEQCVGAIAGTDEGLSFDTLANQVKRNGDSGESILLKMDIEGAEWDSLLATSDELLQGVNQISIEFHRTEDRKYIDLVRKLKKTFT